MDRATLAGGPADEHGCPQGGATSARGVRLNAPGGDDGREVLYPWSEKPFTVSFDALWAAKPILAGRWAGAVTTVDSESKDSTEATNMRAEDRSASASLCRISTWPRESGRRSQTIPGVLR